EKRSRIRDHYQQLNLSFKSKLNLEVRVYNDGFAYRFTSAIKDSIIVEKETAEYSLPPGSRFYGSPVNKRSDVDEFHTSFEEPYLVKPADSIGTDKLFFSPIMIAHANGVKTVITESDLEDYSGTFLRFNDGKMLGGVNAPYPLETRVNPGEFPAEVVTRRADYIARTVGTRTFPWRVFMVSERDSELPSNDMVYRLGSPSRIADTSWLNPGKGTDEWIIGVNLFNVPFKAGVNTATYKYYIDFAKRFGFQRIMMDAGWSATTDLFKINPDINMDEISAYAKSQGIALIMLTLAWTLDHQLDAALKQFKKWGVDFIMTDFMDRDDQKMVNFYHRIAKACAEQKLMIMYHGAFKPAGFSRTWPNSITREAVLGSEYNIWSEKAHPDHDLLLPFIRMTAGPMDYEPGILDNATQKTFRPIGDKVMSMGTRMHQAAMFIVYESPIQLFSGNPSQGSMEPQFMELVGSIPTVWDETIVLDGKVGEYIVTARRKNGVWYVGGMSNWSGKTVEIDFSFLGEGEFEMTEAIDGVNADRYPSDHLITKKAVPKKASVAMAKGGGFVLIIRKK
ncbi:MAG TPA: glycoside hydrolase family 97 protein, partial [Cyclobacteriaceae bacterium]|nr:glycoside hydrolase family 97 protein [Cyclobacteriaceae bacterium]